MFVWQSNLMFDCLCVRLHPASNHTLTRGRYHLKLGGMLKRLTPKLIDALLPATGKRYEVRDALLTGFYVRVASTGKKVFYVSKRIDRKMRRIRIGPYPLVSLRDAREQARTILRDIELGCYVEAAPVEEENLIPTFGEVVPQFIEL